MVSEAPGTNPLGDELLMDDCGMAPRIGEEIPGVVVTDIATAVLADLTEIQRQRARALYWARYVLMPEGGGNPDIADVMDAAEWIVTGRTWIRQQADDHEDRPGPAYTSFVGVSTSDSRVDPGTGQAEKAKADEQYPICPGCGQRHPDTSGLETKIKNKLRDLFTDQLSVLRTGTPSPFAFTPPVMPSNEEIRQAVANAEMLGLNPIAKLIRLTMPQAFAEEAEPANKEAVPATNVDENVTIDNHLYHEPEGSVPDGELPKVVGASGLKVHRAGWPGLTVEEPANPETD